MTRLAHAVCLLALTAAMPSAQTDLDAFMSRVLARRDENWKKLQQYVLDEHERFQATAPGGARVYGFERVYLWFPREGRFIKSPVSIDGVTVGEDERRRAEAFWLQREERREQRRKEQAVDPSANRTQTTLSIGSNGIQFEMESAMREAFEPGFVSAAYFLQFKFDPGQYALAGRETFGGRDVLRIEYYPTKMFAEGRTRPNKELRRRDEDVAKKMNKASLVTLWVTPDDFQIVRYEFANVDFDFLPARSLIRIDDMRASMEMGQPFPGIWLPAAVSIGVDVTLATGQITARYANEYRNYRLASVAATVK